MWEGGKRKRKDKTYLGQETGYVDGAVNARSGGLWPVNATAAAIDGVHVMVRPVQMLKIPSSLMRKNWRTKRKPNSKSQTSFLSLSLSLRAHVCSFDLSLSLSLTLSHTQTTLLSFISSNNSDLRCRSPSERKMLSLVRAKSQFYFILYSFYIYRYKRETSLRSIYYIEAHARTHAIYWLEISKSVFIKARRQ